MTKREREKKKRERARVAHEDSLIETLNAEKAENRFDGAIDPVTGIWKIHGERFNKDELICLDALKEDAPNVIHHLVSKYKTDWWTERDLQGYMSSPRYTGPRPPSDIRLPAEGYLVRACIAIQGGDTSEILDEIPITGLGGRRRSTCFKCEKKFAALCPRCRNKAVSIVKENTPRKPVQSEQPPAPQTEVQK